MGLLFHGTTSFLFATIVLPLPLSRHHQRHKHYITHLTPFNSLHLQLPAQHHINNKLPLTQLHHTSSKMYDINNLAALSNVQLQFNIISLDSTEEYLHKHLMQLHRSRDSLVIATSLFKPALTHFLNQPEGSPEWGVKDAEWRRRWTQMSACTDVLRSLQRVRAAHIRGGTWDLEIDLDKVRSH